MEADFVFSENPERRKVVQLNLDVPQELSSSAQLDHVVSHLGQLEQRRILGLHGLNGIKFNQGEKSVRDPDEILITPTSHLFHVEEQQLAYVGRGDYSVSVGFGYCQGVFLQNTHGDGCFQHNYAWDHFDDPPLVANQFEFRSKMDGATVNKVMILAREPSAIVSVAGRLSSYPKEMFQIGVVPKTGYTYRVWTHIAENGELSFKVTSDDYQNLPLAVNLQPLPT
jgi:hypothetical protein